MPRTSRKYAVNSLQQLIDLNQDLTNFHLKFSCTSDNPTDKFEVLVVNQSQLDDPNSKNLPYKQVQGTITGEVTADKNVYQNYFLIMKAPKECNINVVSDINQIPPKISPTPSPTAIHHSPPPSKNKSVLNSSVFLWVVVGIVALVLIYFIFWPKKNDKTPALLPIPLTPKFLSSKTPTPTISSKKKKKKKKKIYHFNDLEV